MMTKDEHIKLLRRQLWIFIISYSLSAIYNIYLMDKCETKTKELNLERHNREICDSINTINAQYMAGIQAQFDSATKHIRPYEPKK